MPRDSLLSLLLPNNKKLRVSKGSAFCKIRNRQIKLLKLSQEICIKNPGNIADKILSKLAYNQFLPNNQRLEINTRFEQPFTGRCQ